MVVHIFRKPCIDRISMVVGVGSSNLYSFVLDQLYEFGGLQGSLVPQGKITVTKTSKYSTRMCYYPVPGRKIADITIASTKSKYRYFMLTLYPTKFVGDGFENFKDQLELLIPEFRYERLFLTSKVSNIEVAIDSTTEPVSSIIPVRWGLKASSVWEQNGALGTTYLGGPESRLHFRIYDKRKQMLEKGLTSSDAIWARFEATVRRTGLAPFELLKLTNPFSKLMLVPRLDAYSFDGGEYWVEFLDQCISKGSAMALAAFPKRKKKFKHSMNGLAASWWLPDVRWKGYANALQILEP